MTRGHARVCSLVHNVVIARGPFFLMFCVHIHGGVRSAEVTLQNVEGAMMKAGADRLNGGTFSMICVFIHFLDFVES